MTDIQQIKIFNLPVSDLSNENFEINIYDTVATDNGQDIVNFMRNRNLTSSWLTTDSTDAAGTIVEAIIADSATVTDIFIIGHNFKDFDVQYWDGVAWVNFESVTNNTSDFYHFSHASSVITIKVRVVVNSTIIADSDKKITRLVITDKIESGQFISWPEIQKPTQGNIRKDSVMLSGKHFISGTQGSFSVKLKWKGITDQADVDIIEKMFLSRKAFMIWLSGGSEEQFRFKLTGYRKQDLYIVKPSKNYINEYYKGIYSLMLPQSIDLVEVVD